MVLLPGCPCCETCDGVGSLCKYQVSVDGGNTWSQPATQSGETSVLQLEPLNIDGAVIVPRLEVVVTGDAQGASQQMVADVLFDYIAGGRGTSGRARLQISGFLNTQPLVDDYVFFATFGAQISSFGVWEGIEFFPGLYAAGQNFCYLIADCVADPNPSIECNSSFSNRTGNRFYLPAFTAANQLLGNKPSQQLQTTFTAESQSVRVYWQLGFSSPSFITPFSQSTPANSLDSQYLFGLNDLWEYVFTRSFSVKANPLP